MASKRLVLQHRLGDLLDLEDVAERDYHVNQMHLVVFQYTEETVLHKRVSISSTETLPLSQP